MAFMYYCCCCTTRVASIALGVTIIVLYGLRSALLIYLLAETETVYGREIDENVGSLWESLQPYRIMLWMAVFVELVLIVAAVMLIILASVESLYFRWLLIVTGVVFILVCIGDLLLRIYFLATIKKELFDPLQPGNNYDFSAIEGGVYAAVIIDFLIRLPIVVMASVNAFAEYQVIPELYGQNWKYPTLGGRGGGNLTLPGYNSPTAPTAPVGGMALPGWNVPSDPVPAPDPKAIKQYSPPPTYRSKGGGARELGRGSQLMNGRDLNAGRGYGERNTQSLDKYGDRGRRQDDDFRQNRHSIAGSYGRFSGRNHYLIHGDIPSRDYGRDKHHHNRDRDRDRDREHRRDKHHKYDDRRADYDFGRDFTRAKASHQYKADNIRYPYRY